MIDDYIRKVEGLLDRANHKETGEEEREACLAAADRIMKKHRLDRAMLFQAGKPPEREIVVKKYEAIKAEQFSTNLSYMRNAIFRHCGVMFRPGWREGTAVGYEEDIFFANSAFIDKILTNTCKMFFFNTFGSFVFFQSITCKDLNINYRSRHACRNTKTGIFNI